MAPVLSLCTVVKSSADMMGWGDHGDDGGDDSGGHGDGDGGDDDDDGDDGASPSVVASNDRATRLRGGRMKSGPGSGVRLRKRTNTHRQYPKAGILRNMKCQSIRSGLVAGLLFRWFVGSLLRWLDCFG